MDTVRLETMAQTSAITASSVNHGTRETTIGIYGNACSSSGRMCVTVPSSAASANMKAITAQMKLRTRCVFVLFSVRSGLIGLVAAGFALARFALADAFVDDLNRAGIASYLPYAQVSSSDGVYGNGLWSASPLDDPSDDDVDSSASFMPGGTVSFNGGATQVRFVSVHTTSPTNDYWQQWKRSLDELAKLRFDTSRRYVFMGDFNATYDHTPFRNILGNRFSDASRQAGEGLKFSWPANVDYVPSFAGIDHIVLDSGMQAGQVRTVKVDGSDHKALLAIVRVG